MDWTVPPDGASSGAWADPSTYIFKVAYLDGPFVRTYRCRFEAGAVTVEAADNVSFGPTGHAPIRARLT